MTLDGLSIDVSYFVIIVDLSVVTILYTLIAGFTAVVGVEMVQMLLYATSGLIARLVAASTVGTH